MGEQIIYFRDIVKVLSRNLRLIVLTMMVFSVGAVVLTFYVPKRFKSKAVLTIQASYFQNPLVNDLISDVYDPSELRAQRTSLLRLALTGEFLDRLGERYGLFKSARDESLRPLERELLLESIEFFSLSPNTFQIGVMTGDRDAAYEMTKLVLAKMIDTLIRRRERKLLTTRTAIIGHIQSLSSILRNDPKNSVAGNAELLNAELQKIETDLSVLQQHYTSKHPEIMKLEGKAYTLRNRLKRLPHKSEKTEERSSTAYMMTAAARRPINEVHDDLLKKLSNIDIVLDIEKDRGNLPYLAVIEQPSVPTAPMFPKKKVFLGFGMLLGAVVAVVLVIFRELQEGSFMSPYYVSDELEIPLLGELPPLEVGPSKTLLLEEANRNGHRHLLPRYEEGYARR